MSPRHGRDFGGVMATLWVNAAIWDGAATLWVNLPHDAALALARTHKIHLRGGHIMSHVYVLMDKYLYDQPSSSPRGWVVTQGVAVIHPGGIH